MAGETIVLDPTAVATGRTQLDITSYVAAAGPNWGDAEIQAYMADQQVGSTTVDYRLPNRTITIPLNLRAVGATSFSTIRSSLEQKVALFQRQQGQIMRQVGSTPLYADVQSATLHLGGAWLQAYRDVDVDAVLTLECVPDWYGDEVTLTTHTETVLPHLFFTEATINGNYSGRVRIVTTNGTAIDQHGLIWGLRSRYYNAGTTAALFYEAEPLVPLNGAAGAALAGASGGTVITQGSLPANGWVSMLSTSMLAGATPLTHSGAYRVWARCYSGSAVPSFQLLWSVGSLSVPVTNDPVQLPGGGQFYLLDLGVAQLDAPPVGPQQWFGVIQVNALNRGDSASIDCVYLQPLDDGAGKLTYNSMPPPPSSIRILAAPGTGADDSSTGTVAWTNPNNIATSQFATISNMAATSHYLKATNFGFAIPTGATIVGIQAAVTRGAHLTGSPAVTGSVLDQRVRLVKAGTIQTPDRSSATPWPLFTTTPLAYGGPTDLWAGTWAASDINNSGFGIAISAATTTTSPADLQLYAAIYVYYTLASGFTIGPDAVLAASKTTELRTDGMYRQGGGGTVYGPVSTVIGDLPRIPPSGLESRTVQVFLKASRGEFDDEPDSAIDDLSAQIIYRPSFLLTP